MPPIDWRDLYAANQASIRAALPQLKAVAPTVLARGSSAAARPAMRARGVPSSGGALLHVPARLDPAAPAPLVCMLHGCTQNPATFAHGTRMNDAADRDGFIVVYPAQDRARNPQGCWNWFRPEDQRRGAGEPAAIVRIIEDLLAGGTGFTIDRRRVFVAGLSSGGAMAATLAVCYPELFAAVAVHSGLPYGSARDLPSAFRAMAGERRDAHEPVRAARAAMREGIRPVPSIVIHGSADRTVAPANAIQVLHQSMTANHLAAPDRCNHDVTRPTESRRCEPNGGYGYTHSRWTAQYGTVMHELIEVEGLGHAWSGGAAGGSYTDPRGPSATEAIKNFFAMTTAQHPARQ